MATAVGAEGTRIFGVTVAALTLYRVCTSGWAGSFTIMYLICKHTLSKPPDLGVFRKVNLKLVIRKYFRVVILMNCS